MLVICSHCRRHYRHNEQACPFCGSHRSTAVQRLGLGVALAIGVTASIGCGGESAQTDSPAGGRPASVGGDSAIGNGGTSSANGGTSSSTPMGMGGALPAYGLAPLGGTTSYPASGGSNAGSIDGTGGLSLVDSSAQGGSASGGRTNNAYGGAYAAPPSGGASSATKSGMGGMLVAYGPAPFGGTQSGGSTIVPPYGPPPSGGRIGAGGSGVGGAYGPPPSGGNTLTATGGGPVAAYAGPPSGGATPAAAGAGNTSAMECRDDTSGTGWYSGGKLICVAGCHGCKAACAHVGTKSEGWYSSCATSASACNGTSDGLIEYARCSSS